MRPPAKPQRFPLVSRIIGPAVTALALVALAVAAAAEPETAATLVAPAPSYDAGSVEAGTSVTHTFELVNRGSKPVAISVKADCGCTTTDYDPSIPPGGTGKVTAALDTRRVRGRVSKAVRVRTDDPSQPPVVLTITVEASRALDVHPNDHPLLRGAIGAVAPLELTVAAPDGAPFEIVRVEDDPALRAAVAPLADPNATPSAGTGRRYRVTLTPSPTLAVGTHHPKVTLITTRPKAERFELEATVVVTGPLTVTPQMLQIESQKPQGILRITTSRPATPFHVLGVEAGNPAFTAKLVTVEKGRRYQVEVGYQKTASDRPANTLIKISTDEPSQPLLLVRVSVKP